MAITRFDHAGQTYVFDDAWMDVPTCIAVRRTFGLSITEWARGLQPASYDAAALAAMVWVALRRTGQAATLEQLLEPGAVDLPELCGSIYRYRRDELERRLAVANGICPVHQVPGEDGTPVATPVMECSTCAAVREAGES